MADQPKIDVRPEIDDELAELADKVMQRALKNGADQVAVRAGQGHFIELKQRDGKIESSRASRSRGISLTLYCDQRFSSNATSNLQPDALEAFVDRALTLTRVLEPDPHRGLAEPELYGATPDVELDSWDAAYPAGSEDEHLSTLAEIEAGAGQAEDPGSARGTILSVRSSYTLQASSSLQLHSNGFSGARAGTHFYGGATVTADEPGTDRRPEAHAFAGARHREDLPPVSTIGKEAYERAMARLGAQKIESAQSVLVVENRSASRLLGALISVLGGHALDQKRSFLADFEKKRVGSDLLDVHDDPLIARGLGSRTFDGDGLAAKERCIFANGSLETFLISVYYSRKLARPITSGSTSNLLLTPGKDSLEEMISRVDRGVFVTGFLGGNTNPATGDFSLGVMGQRIEAGKLGAAVSEVNVSGNHKALWHRLAGVANDPYPYGSWRIPSLLFEDVQFSGK